MPNVIMYISGEGVTAKAVGSNLTVVPLQPGQVAPPGEKLALNIPPPPEVGK